MTVWHEVEEALEEIIDVYIRINHLISFYQDDRARILGLETVDYHSGVTLELGSGPGNFTEMLRVRINGHIVCIDYSDKMIQVAKQENDEHHVSFLRGIFEYLPLRDGIVDHTIAAFALRDSKDKGKTYSEIGRVLVDEGKLTVVDIGKPNNRIIRGFFSLYMRYIVPIIAGLASNYGFWNPWRLLYETYEILPSNDGLLELMTCNVGTSIIKEISFGCLVVAVAVKSALNISVDRLLN